MKLIWLTVEVGGDVGTINVGINPAQIVSVADRRKEGRIVGCEVWVQGGESSECYAVVQSSNEVSCLFQEATAQP